MLADCSMAVLRNSRKSPFEFGFWPNSPTTMKETKFALFDGERKSRESIMLRWVLCLR
jgi:hypothetical protein